MTYPQNFKPTAIAFQPSLRGRLLQCAAASAAAWVLFPTVAHAAVPAECDEQNNPNIITCVVLEPDEVGPIDVAQDNTTIVIGNADMPTTVNSDAGNAISLDGDGAQTIIINEGSLVNSLDGRGISLTGNGTLSVVTREGSLVASSLGLGFGDAIRVNGEGSIQITAEGNILGFSDGIGATNNGNGSITITATGQTVALNNIGIAAVNGVNGTDVTINTVGGSVSGQNAAIRAVNNGIGVLSLTTSDVVSEDPGSVGISAENSGTNLVVDTTAGEVRARNTGISAENFGSGSISIITADVTSRSSRAIAATNSEDGSTIGINTRAGTVRGNSGIEATNLGSGAVFIRTGDVIATELDGILAVNSGNGSVMDVDTTEGTVVGAQNGIFVAQAGGGSTIVRTAAVVATEQAAVRVESFGEGLTISTTRGEIESGANGIVVNHQGTGLVEITTSQVVGLDGSGIGIMTGNVNSGLALDTTRGAVFGGITGIGLNLDGSDGGSIQTGDVTGQSNSGIFLRSDGGNVSIDSSAGTVSGGEIGIDAVQDGAGGLSILTGTVIGETEAGISAVTSSASTGLRIDTSAGRVESGLDGIFAQHDGTGAASVVTGDIVAETGIGIGLFGGANGDGVTVDTSAGSVNAASVGIGASNFGAGDLSVTTGNVTSADETAIQLTSLTNSDALFLDTTGGSVSGGDTGIFAVHQGAGGMTISTSDVSGTEGALLVLNEGSGDLSITTGNLISANGPGLVAGNGNASFNLVIDTSAGTVSSATNGIAAVQQSSGNLVITSGDVAAGEDGITFQTAGGDTFITNEGTIQSGGFEIAAAEASSGTIEVVNNGAIIGNVSLGSDSDTVTNNGEFIAIGDSAFGTGSDLFSNAGTLQAIGSVVFDDLEQLTNSGSVVMANGDFGDTLRVTGDYVGTNGQLSLDVDLGGAGATDVLVIDGTATGSTVIDVSIDGQFLAFGNSTLLVDAGGATTADAFALAGGDTVEEGFLALDLSFDAANSDFLLGSAVGPAAFRTLKIGEGASSAWYHSADAWSAHIDSARHNPNADQHPVWVQIYGASNDRDDSFGFASSGFTQDIVLDYDQDVFGIQLGAEFGPGVAGDGVFYGATAGYQSSDIDFEAALDSIEYSVFNIGAYVGYKKDDFFAHGLLKYDFINADIDGQSVGYTAEVDGGSIGLRAEAGYRWQAGDLFIEPSVSLDYQSITLDDFSALGASFELENHDGLRGMAGVRFGSDSEVGNGTILTYYGSAHVVHEFAGEGEVAFSTPLSATTLVNNQIGTFGRFDLGLDIATKGGVSGFIEGNADLGGDYSGFGGRAGLRIKF